MLTPTDAFFVAYQEQSGILMHFGVEVELPAPPDRADLERAIAATLDRWPALARTLEMKLVGLAWSGAPRSVIYTGMSLDAFRNRAIDPFREPPFGVMSVGRALAVRCHHAVADGQLFVSIVSFLVESLTGAPPRPQRSKQSPLALQPLWHATQLLPSLRHARWLAREARRRRSVRLVADDAVPGPISTTDAVIDRAALADFAAAERVRPAWLVAAAWMQALHAWSRQDARTVSLEIPVSLRRSSDVTGNLLGVTTLVGDPSRSLGELARDLWHDYSAHVRRRDHLAVPLLSTPARLLPWPIFRRVAVTTSSTGFATSHFTWLAQHTDAFVRSFYTPVCKHMGVALCVLDSKRELRGCLTHRLNAVSVSDARLLVDLLLERIGGNPSLRLRASE